jgi:hypothetical protein
MDLIATTLSIPLIFQIQLPARQRYGLAILLGLGYVVTAASAVRCYYTYKIFSNPLWDQTWFQYPSVLAGSIENDLAVVSFLRQHTYQTSDCLHCALQICACMPALRPLMEPARNHLSSLLSKVHVLTGRVSLGSSFGNKSNRSYASDTLVQSGRHDDGEFVLQDKSSFGYS